MCHLFEPPFFLYVALLQEAPHTSMLHISPEPYPYYQDDQRRKLHLHERREESTKSYENI